MMIKRRANCLVKRLGDGAFYLTKLCFVHGLFTDVVCSNPGYGLSAFNSTAWDEKKKKKKTKNFTLVVMELMRMMPVQLVQDLDNVSIGIGPTEGVSSAIEAENKLVGLSGLVSNGGNHSCRWRQWKSWSIGRDSPTSLCFLYT